MGISGIETQPRKGARAALGALFLAVPLVLPGGAASGFTLPEGCTAFATVQMRACGVLLFWRCDHAPEGSFSQASFSGEGLESVVSYNRDYQWLDAAYSWDSSREQYAPPAADPISRSDLIATGIDTFDFAMHRSTPGERYDIRVLGADMLTGTTRMIDGYELEEVGTRLEIVDDEGNTEYASQGTQYYSRELGLFFTGSEEVFGPDGSTFWDDAPVDIILPGEPRFGTTRPFYGCNSQNAAFPLIAPYPAQQETENDPL
ncbi:MAG: hypothetical protein CSA74_05135 [Rhodobacterales bacterium]|nr:MAG: hypothetical protein CSA74_05135 [Rhodobacterales bacterium]